MNFFTLFQRIDDLSLLLSLQEQSQTFAVVGDGVFHLLQQLAEVESDLTFFADGIGAGTLESETGVNTRLEDSFGDEKGSAFQDVELAGLSDFPGSGE